MIFRAIYWIFPPCRNPAHLKNFKPSDVQDTDEMLPGKFGVELLVDPCDHPEEELLIHGLRQGAHGIVHLTIRQHLHLDSLTDGLWLMDALSSRNTVYLLRSLTFGDILIPNLHSRATQSFQQISRVQTHQIGNFVSH